MSSQVVSVKIYVAVFVALLMLLASTVAVALVEHPAVGLSIALGIAGTKALLIVLFFMNVRHDTASVRLAAVAGFLWLALLISLSLADLLTRGWYPASEIRPARVAPADSRPAATTILLRYGFGRGMTRSIAWTPSSRRRATWTANRGAGRTRL